MYNIVQYTVTGVFFHTIASASVGCSILYLKTESRSSFSLELIWH